MLYTIEAPKDSAAKYTIEPPKAEPETTASGLAASFARGAAPYAAGAAVGAAAGAPFAGVGAGPGALAGMAAVGLTELGTAAYDWLAPKVGAPKVATPQQAMDKALDAIGVKRPSTLAEEFAQTAGGLVPLGFGSVKGAADLGAMVAENRADAAENFIEKTWRSAIRPSVAGKSGQTQIDKANENVLRGMMAIDANKSTLRLATDKGTEVVGRNPQTLDEFVQAIQQTKRPIFAKYDAMAKQAEELGVGLDARPIAAELRKFTANPAFNLPKYEGMREYAAKTAATLEQTGTLPPTVAQGMIKNLNEGLSSFYRASSPEAASRAAVDDLVANRLRASLDQQLELAGIPGYQAAKNEYGALSAIESEVAHRAMIYGRRDPGGGLFGRLGTIASYEELARFATHFDPAALASAAALRGGRKWIEYWNGPNRAVKKMFDKIEDIRSRPEAGGVMPDVAPTSMEFTRLPMQRGGEGQALPPSSAGVPRLAGGTVQAAKPTPTYTPSPQPPRPGGQPLPRTSAGTPRPPGGTMTEEQVQPRRPYIPEPDPMFGAQVLGGGSVTPF